MHLPPVFQSIIFADMEWWKVSELELILGGVLAASDSGSVIARIVFTHMMKKRKLEEKPAMIVSSEPRYATSTMVLLFIIQAGGILENQFSLDLIENPLET